MASIVVVAAVFIFDLIAFSLAIAAEQRRSTATIQTDSNQNSYCVYDSDVSTGYGVAALLLLMASQVLVMAVSRCFCCGRSLRPGGSRACAAILFLLGWLTFIIAESCLLAGSVQNAYHTRYRTLFTTEPPSCETLRKGVFAAGAAFTFFTAILTEFYYVYYSRARQASAAIPPYGYAGDAVRMNSYR